MRRGAFESNYLATLYDSQIAVKGVSMGKCSDGQER